MYYTYVESPWGRIIIAGDNTGVKLVTFQKGEKRLVTQPHWQEADSLLLEASRQLVAYFAGKLQRFSLRLAPEGTQFQQSVWSALQEIPYGETISYRDLALRIGNANGWRAVGAANAQNPLAILIPCHRVIGSTGKLVGYRGGVQIKEALLSFERRNHPCAADGNTVFFSGRP